MLSLCVRVDSELVVYCLAARIALKKLRVLSLLYVP